jgi:RNA polymerase sigma factor FliA
VKSEEGSAKAMNTANSAYQHAANFEALEREKLVLDNLSQVQYIARRIHDRMPKHVPLDDLIQAGVLGLIDAVDHFDPSKNVQLKSYAKFRIKGAILDNLRTMDWSPRDLRRQARRIEEVHLKLKSEFLRAPTDSEVASEMGISLSEYQRLLGDLRGLDLGSLQEQIGEGGEGQDLLAFLPSNPDEDPYAICHRSETTQLLSKSISELDEKERQVLALYYFEELTMKEVGAVLGVGESRVSQIHSGALIRVRVRMRELLDERMPREQMAPVAGKSRGI